MVADHRLRVDFWPCLAGLVLVVVGFLGPWIPHETAALTVTGLELAEFAKFFPQVQGGVVHVTRCLFFTPVTAAAILLGLAVSALAVRPVTRFTGAGLAVLLALVALPPYGFYLAAEYRGHLILAVGGAVLVLLTFLSHRPSRRIWGICVMVLALAGAVPALWQFTLLRPLVAALYDAPLGLGWGLVACAAGFALLLLSGALAVIRR
ncbi:MAG: hypothetical protein DRJ03_20040 [Chloroflexi bacterium]|nr:MAG: hypothetical protein B6I35_05170 [Anaerolineaceae bacterium 4572_32.2]RLC76225.1 MAG: hypothetical protein DRI81_10470 [Chloroflexota bacterium]RLC81581.1 MAG: hypothetical protein DRJ03_20040 [Chloroflexota bacterium]HEY73714.1 hypothetical protein [Thermoflexia bacterium]